MSERKHIVLMILCVLAIIGLLYLKVYIKEQQNEWIECESNKSNNSNNTDCDTFRKPNSVSINCEKYEL